jgi:alkylated DNA repair dioxygenase AlkB
MEAAQPGLFDVAPARFDGRFRGLVRHQLDDEAWVDHLPGWLSGHGALFERLHTKVSWRRQQREMYDAVVDVPRLLARFPDDGAPPSVVGAIAAALTARYDVDFDQWSVALYRTGADSVAWHGDQVARELPLAHVATVSLGAPRPFLLRRVDGGGRHAFRLGWGDLVVMGGACQRTWQHCVPKTASADPRMVLMYRPSASFALWSR